MNYFESLKSLLAIERAADKTQFEQLLQSASTSDRRQSGICWYPIAIRGQELGRADYLTITVERTTHHHIDHQMQTGRPAALFSNYAPQTDRVEGTILHQSGNTLRLTLRTDELPEWARDGKLGIDLLFDDVSYETMNQAIAQATEEPAHTELGNLIQVITGERKPQFNTTEYNVTLPDLNSAQNEAVQKICAANELAIVHGPPGTGKTTTIVAAVQQLLKRNESGPILLVAPSNTAVDLVSEKLASKGVRVVRVGNPARISETLQRLTLDDRMTQHAQAKEIKNLRKRAAEFKSMAHKYKRSFGHAEREQRKALFDEAHRIMKDVAQIENYIVEDELGKAQVITATPVGIHGYLTRNQTFSTVIIDEAGQALEPACWIPILKSRRVIFAGDHCQLPPTIKSKEADSKGLGETLMEKCVKLHPEAVVLLNEQYRMNEAIMGYSSEVFYNGALTAHSSVAKRTIFPEDLPLLYIDTAGCGFEDVLENTSSYNPDEARFLVNHLRQYLELSPASIRKHISIGVISPYKQQVKTINELIDQDVFFKDYRSQISVNTIDSFQGQERDLVYISLVRSNEKGEIGFLADTRRMNVAMTRARKKLVVIGDSATLSRDAFYAGFIQYTEQKEAYASAWEFMA